MIIFNALMLGSAVALVGYLTFGLCYAYNHPTAVPAHAMPASDCDLREDCVSL